MDEMFQVQSAGSADSYPVATFSFSQRNMERKFEARKGAWEYITKGFPTIPLKLTTVAQMSLKCYNNETCFFSRSGTQAIRNKRTLGSTLSKGVGPRSFWLLV